MSEFLHSLRNNNNKRLEKRSRQYNPRSNSHNQRGSGESNGNIDRSKASPNYRASSPDLPLLLSEFLILFTVFMEEHTVHQKQMAEIAKRSEAAKEKSAEALQAIALVLSKSSRTKSGLSQTKTPINKEDEKGAGFSREVELTLSPHSSDNTPRMPLGIQQNYEGVANDQDSRFIPDASINHMKRVEVIDIIRTLRDSGKSFKMVAEYLDAENVPTFSGRGKWYASTIANLLKGLSPAS